MNMGFKRDTQHEGYYPGADREGLEFNAESGEKNV